MNLLRLCLAAALLGFSGLPASAEIIGMEQFDYPDGPVAGRSGGIHWDYKNTTPTAHTGVKSNWDTLAGSATVSNGRLMTSGDGWAKREFNGNTEVNGAVNDSSVATAVYARVTVTTGATLPGYFGISSYDFGDQRIFLGKRGGSSNFGFEIFGGASLDGPVPVPANATFTLVFRLDFSGNAVSLFLNPNFNLPMSDPANAAIGTLVANAGYLGTNWSTALRLSSGGGGDPVAWDDFVVATSWEELGTVVTTLADEDNGNLSGSISLREAVKYSAAGRLITFAPSLSGHTILLNHPDRDMEVPGALIIDASALPGGLTIDHNLSFRHFVVGAGKFLTLRGLNLTKGNLSLSPGLSGGSIDSEGTLILHRCQFIENYGEGGGAIASRGILQATDCNFSRNVAGGGGAVWLSGPAQFVRCTLSRNSGNSAGAIWQWGGNSTLSHCTIVGNSTEAHEGPGALAVQQGSMDLQHCTVTRNTGEAKGGGIYLSSPASVNLAFCIVADNFAFTAPDIFFEGGNQTANAPNLIGDNSSVEANFLPGPLVGTPSNRLNPRLGPLNNYGGSTPTVPLLSGSPARNVGAGSTRLTDQRGFPVLGAADFGAFEAQFSSLADVTVNEDTATGPLPFTAGFTNTITAASDNTTLLPNTGIVLAGSGASRTVTLTPAANQNGTATITLTAATGETLSFPLTVSPVNDAPTISAISDLTINEDANSGPIAFTIGDVETAAATLTMSATSSNTALVPNANITFGGSGASRTVTVTPAANQSGTSTITVTVSDGTTTASDSFVLTVTAVNDAPTITNITDRTINEDANTGAIAFAIGDVETAAASLTVSAASSNTALVPNANITFGGSGASRSVTVTPAANQNGTITITVTVSDGTTTASDTFALAVTAVNDAPSFTKGADVSVTNTAGAQTRVGWATALSPGPPDENAQTLSFTVTNNNNALFTAQPAIGANGTLTFTPAAAAAGTALVTVQINDTGGTANGGVNQSAAQTFNLAITAAAALVVTSTADSGPGSLRQMLADATGQSGPNSITFASGLGTITLTGEIVITDAGGVTIDASDRAAGIVIDGGPGSNRHFRIDAGTTATFHRLRLYGGGGAGGGVPANYGGSIHTGGTLTLRECTFSDNTSANVAGVIYNQDPGLLTIERCSFYGNQAGGTGAIQHESAQRMTVTASTFANNIGRFESGALNVGNRLTTLTHCTITGNAVTNAGGPGVGGVRSTFPANLTVRDCIIAGNTDVNFPGTPNITAGFISQGNNLTSGDPKLAALGDYGGPTWTMPPMPGSPAIDGALSSTTAQTDQRGAPRLMDGNLDLNDFSDIGAVESPAPLTVTITADQNDTPAGPQLSLREAIRDATAGATILFNSTFNGEPGDTISLSQTLGQIIFTRGLIINASANPGGVTIDGGPGTNRIFQMSAGTGAYLNRLTLTGGNGGGGGTFGINGGAINCSSATVALTDCALSGNMVSGAGGALINGFGTLTVNRCLFSNNSGSSGGAVYSETASLSGPATSSTTLTNCTIINNTGLGGAIYNNNGHSSLLHCTITGNTSTSGTGNGVRSFGDTDTRTTVQNCIIAGNTNATDVSLEGSNTNSFLSLGGNLIGSGSATGAFNQSRDGISATATTLRLALLSDFGGPTQTIALRPGSPALGNAVASVNLIPITTDQRGFPAVGLKDSGAYEAGNNLLTSYNSWIWETLPHTANEGDAVSNADFDRDGQTNEAEWLAQTNPGNPGSVFGPTGFIFGQSFVVEFPTVTGRTYRLEFNENLAAGNWFPILGSEIEGDGSLKSYSLSTSVGSRRFFRVQIIP